MLNIGAIIKLVTVLVVVMTLVLVSRRYGDPQEVARRGGLIALATCTAALVLSAAIGVTQRWF